MDAVEVVDSSPLIVFARSGNLQLLTSAFSPLVAPIEVKEEVRDFPGSIVQVKAVANKRLVESLCQEVGKGESAAIALALEVANGVVVLDDHKGRRVAAQLGLRVVGSLGVVLHCKQIGVIPTVKDTIQALRNAGLFLSRGLIDRALYAANE